MDDDHPADIGRTRRRGDRITPLFAAAAYDRLCEGFRMPATHDWCRTLRWPASENLQGRKPRWGDVGGATGAMGI